MKLLSITNFFFLILLSLLFSCSVIKPTYYFQDIKRDTVITNTAVKGEALKIKLTDVLTIQVSSLSKDEDELFSRQVSISGNPLSNEAVRGFSLDKNGNIHIHKLGLVKAEGLTRAELKATLEQQLQPYLKDPLVTVNFANHFITVIGDVNRPQQLNMPDESMSLLEVMAQSGNANTTAQLNNLMVIREKDKNSKEFKHISLEGAAVFSSDWYYLQPNDVVVVNPDVDRIVQTEKRLRYQQISSVVLQALSIIIIVTNIFRN
jgi:polysaccharide export outer membrane protein